MEAVASTCVELSVMVYRCWFQPVAGVLEHSVPTSRNFRVLVRLASARGPDRPPASMSRPAGDTAASSGRHPDGTEHATYKDRDPHAMQVTHSVGGRGI